MAQHVTKKQISTKDIQDPLNKISHLFRASDAKIAELQQLLIQESKLLGYDTTYSIDGIRARQECLREAAQESLDSLSQGKKDPTPRDEPFRGTILTVSIRKSESRKNSPKGKELESTMISTDSRCGTGYGSLDRHLVKSQRKKALCMLDVEPLKESSGKPNSHKPLHPDQQYESPSRRRSTINTHFGHQPFLNHGNSTERFFESNDVGLPIVDNHNVHNVRRNSAIATKQECNKSSYDSSELNYVNGTGLSERILLPTPPPVLQPSTPSNSVVSSVDRHNGYLEETKPFEMEDYYKYSVKFRGRSPSEQTNPIKEDSQYNSNSIQVGRLSQLSELDASQNHLASMGDKPEESRLKVAHETCLKQLEACQLDLKNVDNPRVMRRSTSEEALKFNRLRTRITKWDDPGQEERLKRLQLAFMKMSFPVEKVGSLGSNMMKPDTSSLESTLPGYMNPINSENHERRQLLKQRLENMKFESDILLKPPELPPKTKSRKPGTPKPDTGGVEEDKEQEGWMPVTPTFV